MKHLSFACKYHKPQGLDAFLNGFLSIPLKRHLRSFQFVYPGRMPKNGGWSGVTIVSFPYVSFNLRLKEMCRPFL